jgi:ectoine hydroxylase-related dioxygenase (phytanoyl-CoA dioxygenase family)
MESPRAAFLAIVSPTWAQWLQFRLKEPTRQRRSEVTGSAGRDRILAEVEMNGFTVIENYLSADECAAGIAEFEAAITRLPDFVRYDTDKRIFGLEHASPVAAKFLNDPQWLAMADAYAGEPNTPLCIMANKIEYDGTDKLGSGGEWHRDCFARELKAIVYLSDVGPDNGPFQIVATSHSSSAILADMKAGMLNALQNRLGDDAVRRVTASHPSRIRSITGKAGTAIVFDTSSIHTGTPIRAGTRYALTNYLLASRTVTEETYGHFAPVLREAA